MLCASLNYETSNTSEEEKNGKDNSNNKNGLFSPAFGQIDIAFTAKSAAQARAPVLQKNKNYEENRNDDLSNIEPVHIV